MSQRPTSPYPLFIIAVLILLTSGCKKKDGELVTIGEKKTLYSSILKEDRGLWIHVPEKTEQDTTSKFPVLYLLDGDSHFYSVVGLIHQLSTVYGNDVCPKMIIVGIPNTNRMRDLTPTHVASPRADSSYYKPSGGGAKFTDFLSKELIPYIEQNYPATNRRVLVGHSLGGLMVINTMINQKDLFDKYISIDPSLWWNNRRSLQEYESALASIDLKGKGLFIAIANTIETDTVRAMIDTTEETDHFRAIIHFREALKKAKTNLDWNYKYYGDEGHSSVPLIAEYDALHFLFRKIPITLDYATLKSFEGTYKHQFAEGVDSFIEITAVDSTLVLHEQWSGRKIRFNALSRTDFYAVDSQFPLRFVKDNSGQVKHAVAFNRDVWTRSEN